MKGGKKVVEIAEAGEAASVNAGVVVVVDVASTLEGQGTGFGGVPVELCGRYCPKNELGSALTPILYGCQSKVGSESAAGA